MRLTLRTLLAWKDGMLDAEAARDLAARVEESPAAHRLIERIDAVVARPAPSASDPADQGFVASANAVAEYLDNALPAERLVEFERDCLASDASLAEAAACHDILAAWSREPAAALDRAARRRLLAQARARSTQPPARGLAPTVRPAVAARQPSPARGSAPAAAWLLVAGAVLVLFALVGVLGWSLANRSGRKPGPAVAVQPAPAQETAAPAAAAAVEAAVTTDARDDAGTADLPGGPPEVADASAPPEPPSAGDVPPAAAVVPAAEGEVQDRGAPPPPTDVVAPPSQPAAPVPTVPRDRLVPQGSALAIAAPAGPAAESPPATPPPAAGQAAPEAGAAAVVAGPAVLLHRPVGGAADAWLTATDGTMLELPADLVAPPFVRPTVTVGGTRITLEPGTRAVLARDTDGAPRLEVVFGGAAAVGGDRLGVTAGGLAGVVKAAVAAPVGIEVVLVREPGASADSTRRIARVVPSADRLDWRQPSADGGQPGDQRAGLGDSAEIAAGQSLVWRSEAPALVAREAAGPPSPWLAGRPADDPVATWAAAALVGKLTAGTAAVPMLRQLAVARRSEGRMAAAAALAMLGEFDELARLLAATGGDGLAEGTWTRLEAAAVQPALARGPRAAAALEQALAAHAPPGTADLVVRCARGFTDDELAAGAAAELVDALESPHLLVRRYAIKNLTEITGVAGADRLRYRADRPAEALREDASWWRKRLERGGIHRAAAAADADR